MDTKYPFNITWSEDDGEFVATCSGFPRLSAFGETEEEALKEGKIALQLFIEACIAQGIPLPEPQVVHDYSGQVRLRLSKYLHQQAARRAEIEGVSLNTFFVDAIAMRVGAENMAERLVASVSASTHPEPLPQPIVNLFLQEVMLTPASSGFVPTGVYRLNKR